MPTFQNFKSENFDNQRIMDGRGSLQQDAAFVKLQEHFNQVGNEINIAKLFASDSGRFSKFR